VSRACVVGQNSLPPYSLRIYFFHSGGQIKKYPDSLPNSADACGRKLYLERKSCGFEISGYVWPGPEDLGETKLTVSLVASH